MALALLLLMLVTPYAAWAEGDETDATYSDTSMNQELPPPVDSDIPEPSHVGPKIEPEPIALQKPLTTPPAPSPEADQQALSAQMRELKAQLDAVKAELAQVKKTPTSTPATPATPTPAPGAIAPAVQPITTQQPVVAQTVAQTKTPEINKGADPIANLLGEDDSESSNPAEREATAKARESAGPGTLTTDSVHDQYNRLCGLYNEAMIAEGEAFKAKATQFKAACASFINQHKDHSFSRSAIFYLGGVLLKNGENAEAQQAFATAYKGDEKGPHAADALLGMAEVSAKNGQKDFAVGFLSKVKKDFDPHHLTEDTKEKFKHVAKLVNANLTLGSAKQTAVVTKGTAKTPNPKAHVQTTAAHKKAPTEAKPTKQVQA